MHSNRKIKDLHKLEGNPRIIKDDDFHKLCTSIKENPEYFPARPIILSNRTGKLVIIGGNQRYEAAKHNGLKEVPTYLIEGLTEEKEKEIIIRDNVNNGKWDWDLLANNFNDQDLDDWGVDMPFFDAQMNIEGDQNTPAVNLQYLSFGKCKVPITPEELSNLETILGDYVEKNTLSIGFAKYLVDATRN